VVVGRPASACEIVLLEPPQAASASPQASAGSSEASRLSARIPATTSS